MTPEEQRLILSLVLAPNAGPPADADDVLRQLGAPDGRVLGARLLRGAAKRRDPVDVEMALIVMAVFGVSPDTSGRCWSSLARIGTTRMRPSRRRSARSRVRHQSRCSSISRDGCRITSTSTKVGRWRLRQSTRSGVFQVTLRAPHWYRFLTQTRSSFGTGRKENWFVDVFDTSRREANQTVAPIFTAISSGRGYGSSWGIDV